MAFRTRHHRTDRSEVELMRGLVTLANELQSSLELSDVVGVIVTAVGRTFGFRETAVYLADPDEETFRVHATAGEHPEYDGVLFDRPIPRRVLDELFLPRYQVGTSYFVDSSHEWTEEQLHYLPAARPRAAGTRTSGSPDDELFVPLFDKRREIIGVLDLFDPKDRQVPSLELVKSLEVFAAQAAVAIENARQYKALEDATAQLAAQLELRHGLIELSAALLTTLDQRELFARVAALLKDFVDYDAMEIRLVDEATHELYCGFASEQDLAQMSELACPARRRRERVGRHAQRGAARQRHAERPTRRARAGHRVGPAGVHHRPAHRRRLRDRRARPRPHGRPHLLRGRAGAHQAVRQPRGHRDPQRASVRGGADGLAAARAAARPAAPAPGLEHDAAGHPRPRGRASGRSARCSPRSWSTTPWTSASWTAPRTSSSASTPSARTPTTCWRCACRWRAACAAGWRGTAAPRSSTTATTTRAWRTPTARRSGARTPRWSCRSSCAAR